MKKKLIKTNDGIFELGVEELLPMFDNLLKKFSHKCVEDLSGFESNRNEFNDYYQIGVLELMGAFERYDHTKGATFFTHLHRELHYRLIMMIREFNAEKRKPEKPLVYIDKKVEDCEVSNIIKDKDDKYFDKKEDKLENFLSENLTKTERLLIAVYFRKKLNKSKGLYKNSLEYAIDVFDEETNSSSISKSELADKLNISRPTLNKRMNEAVEKMKKLAERYVYTQQLDSAM